MQSHRGPGPVSGDCEDTLRSWFALLWPAPTEVVLTPTGEVSHSPDQGKIGFKC